LADEIRSHPPTERRLARLWSEGITPAGPALVALATMAAGCALGATLWPLLAGGARGLIADGLALAARPEGALTGARVLALRGAAVGGALCALVLLVALVAMAAQAGPRAAAGGGTVRPPDASDGARRAPAVADAGRGTLLAGLALVTVAASLRAVLGRGEELAMGGDVVATAAQVAQAIAWPVLAVLTGAALLDAIARRVAWTRAAWMSRRELEEELRETEGHPLARRRRAPERRRRRHA